LLQTPIELNSNDDAYDVSFVSALDLVLRNVLVINQRSGQRKFHTFHIPEIGEAYDIKHDNGAMRGGAYDSFWER